MNITLHKRAQNTYAIRKEIQESTLFERALAKKYNLHRATIHKWKNRSTVEDYSHRPHELHATLSSIEETIVVELRKCLLLPLDDLLVIVHEFINPTMSRSALDRCLRRHGVSNLKQLMPEEDKQKKPVKSFKDYVPGYIHIDVKYLPKMPDEHGRKYLFVAIDRATRWVFMEVRATKSARSAESFVRNLLKRVPFIITKILTDNGKEFTDRFCATGQRKPTGNHLFDQQCKNSNIQHRLTKSRTPQTNGMVERFNGRISEVVKQTRFTSAKQLKEVLLQYCRLYNHNIAQKNLGHLSPIQSLRNWSKTHPQLFTKSIYNQSGLDNYKGVLQTLFCLHNFLNRTAVVHIRISKRLIIYHNIHSFTGKDYCNYTGLGFKSEVQQKVLMPMNT